MEHTLCYVAQEWWGELMKEVSITMRGVAFSTLAWLGATTLMFVLPVNHALHHKLTTSHMTWHWFPIGCGLEVAIEFRQNDWRSMTHQCQGSNHKTFHTGQAMSKIVLLNIYNTK